MNKINQYAIILLTQLVGLFAVYISTKIEHNVNEWIILGSLVFFLITSTVLVILINVEFLRGK